MIFKDFFPTIQINLKNQRISSQVLQCWLQKLKFPFSYRELDKLMLYFVPNKKVKSKLKTKLFNSNFLKSILII